MLYALEEQRSRKHQEVSLLAEKLGAWEASGQGNADYDRNKKFQDRMKHVREKAEVDKCVRQERIQQAEMNVAAAADEVVSFFRRFWTSSRWLGINSFSDFLFDKQLASLQQQLKTAEMDTVAQGVCDKISYPLSIFSQESFEIWTFQRFTTSTTILSANRKTLLGSGNYVGEDPACLTALENFVALTERHGTIFQILFDSRNDFY